LQLRCRWI